MSNDPRSIWRRLLSRKKRKRDRRARRLGHEPLESRLLLTTALIRFEFANTSGTVVNSLNVGQDFLVRTYIQDIRDTPEGFFQAFLDVNYQSSLASAAGPSITPGPAFAANTSGDLNTAGVVDEAGGFDTDQLPPLQAGQEQLLFTATLQADTAGTLNLTGDLAESPVKQIVPFNSVSGLLFSDLEFAGGSIDIAGVAQPTVNVTPTSPLNTDETGAQATFNVSLGLQPSANVTIPISSSDTGEGTVSASSLTFTTSNWDTPQQVVVTGEDDDVQDGDIQYTIVTGAASSSDSGYNGLAVDDLTLTNEDDDVAGVVVTPLSGLSTTESGGTAMFSVVLESEPTANVTISLTSDDTDEGTVSPSSLTFTPANWDTAQQVTITGVDDALVDGEVDYNILTGAASSSDNNYSSLAVDDVSVTNQDNDVPQILVAPTSGLITTEAGGEATFEVSLGTQPTANVTIGITSSDTSEGTVSTSQLTFTNQNFDQPQTVTVTGVDDLLDDGDIAYTVITANAVSSDPSYSGRQAADVAVANADNDVPQIVVIPTSGLTTGEDGGTAEFNVSLSTEPTANVTIGISSSDISEGAVSTSTLTFTPANWDTAQAVTVTGVDDEIDDGDVAYEIVTAAAVSSDTSYSGRDAANVQVSNMDDDVAQIQVAPTSGLVTSESGGEATFNVSLSSEPTSNVTIGVSSDDTGEGTVSTSSLVFTAANWDTPQQVTVTGVDDDIDDGNQDYMILTAAAVSSDSSYSGRDGADVLVTNTDDDVAGIQVAPTSGLTTSEDGGTADFSVVLTSEPTANVTIGLSSSDTTEGTPGVSSLTFTPANWDAAQMVTVTGADDQLDDGDIGYQIVTAAATSSDNSYSGLNAVDVSATNTDNDAPQISVSPTTGLETSEQGGTDTFTISLSRQPASNVTISLSSSDPSEGTPNVSSLTFTTGNWDQPQQVTVTGAADQTVDGDVAYSIITGSAVSGDPEYGGLAVSDVQVVNLDEDSATITLEPVSISEGSSGPSTMMLFRATLSDDVASGFDVAFSLADGTATASSGDYSGSGGALSFSGDASEVQFIEVAVSPDTVVEADETLTAALGAISGLDPALASRISVAGSPATGTIVNDDAAVLRINSPAPTEEGSSGGTTPFVFDVELIGQVQDGFNAAYTTNDDEATTADGDYVSNAGTLSFSGAAGQSQSITVQVNHDQQSEGDEDFLVTITSLTGLDPTAADDITIDNNPATGTILDDDVPRLLVDPVAVDEGTGAGSTSLTFELRLTGLVDDPSGFDVPFSILNGTASAGSDFTSNSGSLHYDGFAGETQTVTVAVSRDSVVEADETLQLMIGTITNLAPGEEVVTPSDPVTGTIRNDDMATLTLAATTSLQQDEGDGAGVTTYGFEVTLDNAVQGGFDIAYATDDETASAGSDYTGNDGTLSFNGTQGESRTFSVSAQRDEVVEADETFLVALGAFSNIDAGLADGITIAGSPLTATIDNDDTATLTLGDSLQLNEGNGGGTTSFAFPVTLSGAVEGGLTLSFAVTDETTTSGEDYANSGGALAFTGADQETQTIEVLVQADAQVEMDERFRVALGQLLNAQPEISASVSIDDGSATGTVVNDDASTLTLVSVQPVQEGTNGPTTFLNIEVQLSDPVAGGLMVAYTVSDGTATTSDNDYQDNDGSLGFVGTANEVQMITVHVTPDDRVESDETLEVVLGALSNIDPELAALITIVGGPETATILNDEFATVSFADDDPIIIEASGQTVLPVVLSITDGGTLSEPITVGISDQGTGTATDGVDYTLETNSATFPAGSRDGETRDVQLTIVEDELTEPDETIDLELTLDSAGVPGSVALGTALSTATISDDPMTASVSGVVFVDANNNGQRDANELGLPGVTIRLEGTDLRGQTVEVTTASGDDGSYSLRNLPGGTYTVTEVQPSTLHDGIDTLGTVEGSPSGVVGDDQFAEVQLAPAATGTGYNFGELGLKAAYVTPRTFLVSTWPPSQMMRDKIALSAELSGDEMLAAAIREDRVVEVRRIGSEVTILGSSRRDNIVVRPAVDDSPDAEHVVDVNGQQFTFDPALVDSLMIDGGDGQDDVIVHDTSGSDSVVASQQTVRLTGDRVQVETAAAEYVKAVSSNGGADSASQQPLVDMIFELEGDWLP